MLQYPAGVIVAEAQSQTSTEIIRSPANQNQISWRESHDFIVVRSNGEGCATFLCISFYRSEILSVKKYCRKEIVEMLYQIRITLRLRWEE